MDKKVWCLLNCMIWGMVMQRRLYCMVFKKHWLIYLKQDYANRNALLALPQSHRLWKSCIHPTMFKYVLVHRLPKTVTQKVAVDSILVRSKTGFAAYRFQEKYLIKILESPWYPPPMSCYVLGHNLMVNLKICPPAGILHIKLIIVV